MNGCDPVGVHMYVNGKIWYDPINGSVKCGCNPQYCTYEPMMSVGVVPCLC